jgi:hypothetical protein
MVNWKRVVWISVAFFIVYSNPANCQPKPFECKLSIVNWRDTVVYTRKPLADDIDTMVADVVAIGCVVQTEKTVLVIQNITQGTPDVYMVIPKDWVQSIVQLKIVPIEKPEVKEKEKK